MKIFVANSAYNDLENIEYYYRDEGVPHIGRNFINEMIKHIQVLKDNPDIGRIVPEFGDKKIRELIHRPFRIVYLRECDSIHIIRVWRSEWILELPTDKT